MGTMRSAAPRTRMARHLRARRRAGCLMVGYDRLVEPHCFVRVSGTANGGGGGSAGGAGAGEPLRADVVTGVRYVGFEVKRAGAVRPR